MALRSLQSIQTSTLVGPVWPVAGSGSSRTRAGSDGNSSTVMNFCKLERGGDTPAVWKLGRLTFHRQKKGIICRSSGGSKRDNAKIVARTQKRRSRHVKGVTPTKGELLDKLQAEEEADADLERFQASRDVDSETSSDSEGTGEDNEEEPSSASNGKSASNSTWDEDASSDPGVEEITDNGDDTYTIKYFPEGKSAPDTVQDTVQDVSSIGQDTAEDVSDTVQDVSSIGQDIAEDVSSTAQDAAEESQQKIGKASDEVQEDAAGTADDVGKAAGEVSNIAQGTTDDVSDIAQGAATDISDTLQDSAKDLTNITDDATTPSDAQGVQEVVDSGSNTYTVKYYPDGKGEQATTQDAAEVTGKVSDVGQDTAQRVAGRAQEAASDTSQSLGQAGEAVQENVQESAEQLQSTAAEIGEVAQDTVQDVTKTAQQTGREVGQSVEDAREAVVGRLDEVGAEGRRTLQEGQQQAEETRGRAEKAFDKVSAETGKTFQSVQDSLANLAEESRRAAGTIGDEALRLGEVVLGAAGQVIGLQPPTEEVATTSNGSSSQQPQKPTPKAEGSGARVGVTANKPRQVEGQKDEEKDLYKGLTVTVAGASGRTGRILVEELSKNGVPVTALVRDRSKSEARALEKLPNVKVVRVDLYNYEAVKKSLGDSNVVISAVGARSFPFDPIGTYQAEFEGVKNLVAAAKNKGDVKKFVFITSLGVTFLQIVPLIFWKKQSELYLQRSGLDYTIVRPGGLTNATNTREAISIKAADTQFGGSISRRKVAEVCIAALITPEASEKTVEVVSSQGESKSYSALFGSV